MDPFTPAAIALTLAAACACLNAKTIRLPTTIGVMTISLAFSLALLVADRVFPQIGGYAEHLVARFEFDDTVLRGLLGFLLFAGALHVDAGDLSRQRVLIATLAVVGTAISTALVGLAAWAVAIVLGRDLPPAICLLFGALIAPTDPVAVLGMLNRVAARPDLTAKIAGESLFNDGVGVVIFLALFGFAVGGHGLGAAGIAKLFLIEGVGGAAFGLFAG